MRADKLEAHDGRFDSANHQKKERAHDVHDAQSFVIDRRHPFVKPIYEWS
jgi:hypothetical protein